MKNVNPDPELLRLAADFVERSQPIVNIKRSILEPLRHDWTGDLLKLQNEVRVLLARFRIEIFRETEQQNIAQEIKNRFFGRGIAALRAGDRAFNNLSIFLAHGLPRHQVSPINGETRDRFAHRALERFKSEIAIPAILFR